MGGRHNPLRSEEEAFRWAVTIVGGCGAVIALTLLTRPVFGVALLVALVALGVGFIWRDSRGRDPRRTEVTAGEDGRHRIMVVANQTVGGGALIDEISKHAGGRETEVLVVTPALTGSRLKHLASDIDGAIEAAQQRLEHTLEALRQAGIEAHGEVGDSEPNVAIEDALRTFGADELIVSTLPPGKSHWLEKGVVERARSEIGLPVTHVVVDIDAEATT